MSEKITPELVRDKMCDCFYKAHCEDSDLGGGEEVDKMYCKNIVKKAFAETGGDYDSPDKKSIMNAMGYLAEFSRNFRDPKVIRKHSEEIMNLVNQLPD